MAADLVFKKNKNLSWSQQMGVVVAMLLQQDKRAWIDWAMNVCPQGMELISVA